MGCSTLSVFKTDMKDETIEEIIRRHDGELKIIVELLEKSAKSAEKFGVTLAFQNHKPLIDNYKDALKMVNEISSENIKLSLDAPLFYAQDDEYVRNVVLETGKDLIVHSHFGGEFYRQHSHLNI